jgi:hypothetical protein
MALGITTLLVGGVIVVTRPGHATSDHIAPPIPAASAKPTSISIPTVDRAPGTVAASPSAAVTAFLQAEIDRRFADSLAIMSDADRTSAGPLEIWSQRHADLPTYTGFTVDRADGNSVVTTVSMVPQLDETTGYTPASAHITWTTIQEAGGYRLSLDSSTSQPVIPDPAGAKAAALAWADGQQHGQSVAQYTGNLLGQSGVTEGLQQVTGTFTASEPNGLESFAQPSVVTSAFGPDAATWTRVVNLSGPMNIAVVTAPLGDQWVVVAVATR